MRARECTHTQRNEVKWDEQIVPLTAETAPHTTAPAATQIFTAMMTVDLGNF